MKPSDMVYNAIYKGALDKRCAESVARDHAVMGLDAYKKNKFKTPKQLIDDYIKRAVVVSKGVK